MDYAPFFSKIALRRQPSVIQSIFDETEGDNSYLRLAAGIFSPEVFVIKSGSLTLSDGTTLKLDAADTASAMQYIETGGHPEILQFVTELTQRLHQPPTMCGSDGPGTMATMLVNGAQDGIYKTLETLVDENSIVISPEPMYASFLASCHPLGCKIQGIKTDADGIIPERLAEYLASISKTNGLDPDNRKLKLLYCVPNGDNPSGIRYTEERKREIYRLAREYNFLILEDDPYYFLETEPRPASFLSMDVDGRVLRLDTFSKTVSPGLRMAYLSGPRVILSKVIIAVQNSTQGCSSWSQVVLLQLIRRWGLTGYLQHCAAVKAFYDSRRSSCIRLAEKYLTGIAEWVSPTGGLFLWVRFPGLSDALPLVKERLLSRKVLVVAGSAFYPAGSEPVPCIRISFSIAMEQELEQGIKIIAEEVRKLQEESVIKGK